jgi:hypothetical protein
MAVEVLESLSLSTDDGGIGITQDFTPGFTPDAWIVITSLAATDGDTGESHIASSIGFSDGANQYSVGSFSRDGASVILGQFTSADTIRSPGSSPVTTFRATSALSGSSIRLTYAAVPALADRRRITVVAMSGSFEAFDFNTSDASPVSGLTLQPTQALFIHAGSIGLGNSATRAVTGIGAASDSTGGVTQGAVCTGYTESGDGNFGRATASNAVVAISDTGTLENTLAVAAFTSDGFSYTDTGSGAAVACLAMSHGGKDTWSGLQSTLTTATPYTLSVTDPDLNPDFALMVSTPLSATDTSRTDDEGGVFDISADDGSTVRSSSFAHEDGLTTSNSFAEAQSVHLPLDDGTFGSGALEATGAFTASGIDLLYSANDTTETKRFFLMAFGDGRILVQGDETEEVQDSVRLVTGNMEVAPPETVNLADSVALAKGLTMPSEVVQIADEALAQTTTVVRVAVEEFGGIVSSDAEQGRILGSEPQQGRIG